MTISCHLPILALISMLLTALLASSSSIAALPEEELWREELVSNVVGFGKNTTGGKGGTLCRVTSLNDSGAGSLRFCMESDKTLWIIFDVSGVISLKTEILVKSNKTIDGRGQNITITNRGFEFGSWTKRPNIVSNVIIHNITMRDSEGNGMIMLTEDSSNIWIDHVTFGNAIDERLYIGSNGSDGGYRGMPPHGITVSWIHCSAERLSTPTQGGRGQHCLLISDPSLPEDVGITVTLHHNFYDRTWVRHPYARHATIHAFNNYYNKVHLGAQLCTGAKFYSENEIFDWGKSQGLYNPMVVVGQCGAEAPAAHVKVVNPFLLEGARVDELNPNGIFTPSSFYAYTADAANVTLRSRIINQAGRRSVLAPRPLRQQTSQ